MVVMEEKDGRMVVDNNNVISIMPSTASNLPLRKKHKMNTLRWIILFFFRGRIAKNNKKTATIGLDYDITKTGKKGLFRKIFCAIHHPLYNLEEKEEEDNNNNSTAKPPPPPPETIDMVVNDPKISHSASFSSDWLSSDRTSHYESTDDLRGLVASMEEEEENNSGAPYDIDLQAEEFIARFYEQMKLQNISKL